MTIPWKLEIIVSLHCEYDTDGHIEDEKQGQLKKKFDGSVC